MRNLLVNHSKASGRAPKISVVALQQESKQPVNNLSGPPHLHTGIETRALCQNGLNLAPMGGVGR